MFIDASAIAKIRYLLTQWEGFEGQGFMNASMDAAIYGTLQSFVSQMGEVVENSLETPVEAISTPLPPQPVEVEPDPAVLPDAEPIEPQKHDDGEQAPIPLPTSPSPEVPIVESQIIVTPYAVPGRQAGIKR